MCKYYQPWLYLSIYLYDIILSRNWETEVGKEINKGKILVVYSYCMRGNKVLSTGAEKMAVE